MCDCIEELDRLEKDLPGRDIQIAPQTAPPIPPRKGPPIPPQTDPPIPPPSEPPIPPRRCPLISLSALDENWPAVLGGATLLALIAFLYKSRDKMKKLLWTEAFYGPTIKKWKEFLILLQKAYLKLSEEEYQRKKLEETRACICEDYE